MKSRDSAPRGARLLRPAVFALAALALAGLAFAGYESLRPLRVGLYGLDAVDIQAFKKLGAMKGLARFTIVELDPAKPIAAQLSGKAHPDIVVAHAGMAMADAASRFSMPADSTARLLPTAIREAASMGKRRYGLALEVDHFELAARDGVFPAGPEGRATAGPGSLAGLEKTALSLAGRKSWPVFVAGAEDDDLLLLVTALVEARGGAAAVTKLAARLASGQSLGEALDTVLSGEGGAGELTLRGILAMLGDWRARGILHPEWYRMRGGDLEAFMAEGMAPIVLMPLSRHRIFPAELMAGYKVAPFPSAAQVGNRSLVAPLLTGAAVSGGIKGKAAATFLARLLGAEAQGRLCASTGLAPAAAAAEALDLEASQTRLWVAASAGALADIGRAAAPTGAARAAIAREIRQYIEAGGAGY